MANTPFLDLVKPAGTDKALVSVLNSNSDKIDGGVSTLSEQIGTYEIPTNTIANIEAALVTYASGLANNEIRTVKFTVNPATTMFAASSYMGTIRKVATGRFNILVQGFLDATQLFTGNYRNSTWTWEQLAAATPSSITLTTESDVTINKGGAYRVGGLVVVQLNITLSANKNGGLINGLPAPMNAGSVTVVSLAGGGSVNAAGQIRGTLNAGTYIFTGAYVPAS